MLVAPQVNPHGGHRPGSPASAHSRVTPEFTAQEAQALLTCVREYFALLLEQRRLGDQNLSSAASSLYAAMIEAGVTPDRLE
jgi:hypothetical protein